MPTIETGLGTVIITGSGGLIGSAFLAHVGERYTELCLDSKGPPQLFPKTARMIACDLTSDENLHQALDEVRRLGHRRIASILHLAAYYRTYLKIVESVKEASIMPSHAAIA